jgi:tetratricopeptide (TPR) repeat protein
LREAGPADIAAEVFFPLGVPADVCLHRTMIERMRDLWWLRAWQQAVEDFTQALLVDRSDAEDILVRRAACYHELGRLDEAQRDLDEHAKLLTV